MKSNFIHKHPQFKQLIEIVTNEQQINEPSLVEKDYWLMHCLFALQQSGLQFELKGGTSLSKGFGIIDRFSEDIDIKIFSNTQQQGFKVFDGKNHDDPKHRLSRQQFFDWLAIYLKDKIDGIVSVERDHAFDDIHKFRNGGIRLRYESFYQPIVGLKDGILLEVGFDITAPNLPQTISSWIYEKAAHTILINDNRARAVACYDPRYTFVEKLQTIVRKFRFFREKQALQDNFLRHFYDIYQLLDTPEVQQFIGTVNYQRHKKIRFGSDDLNISNCEAFTLSLPNERKLFEVEYQKTRTLYFRRFPTLDEILSRIGLWIDRL